MSNIRVLATGLEFPEGPVVMPDGSVVLVEIRGKRLTRVYPDGRKEVVAEIPGGPNGAALGPDGKMYICNNGGFSWIPTRQDDHAGAAARGLSRRLDPAGGYAKRQGRDRRRQMRRASRCGGRTTWCSTGMAGFGSPISASAAPATWTSAAFYYLKPGMKEIVEGVHGVLPANGIGLSPDENTVYIAETPTARLWAYDLSAPGTVKPRDVIYRGERGKPIAGLGGYQMFDSLAVEATGNVCVATLISGCISVIAPDGTAGRAGPDRRPRHHQHRLRRPRAQDRLHHAVRQGRTDRDGLGAPRPAAEFFE